MSTEGSYDFWREVFAGVKDCGRAVEIDMHAKGIDQRTIDLARETGLPAADEAEAALANASRIRLLVTTAYRPSASNKRYWPELYTNMPVTCSGESGEASLPHPYGDAPNPKRFGTVTAPEPELFSTVDDYAEELATGDSIGRYSPRDVAEWLEEFAGAAMTHLLAAENIAAANGALCRTAPLGGRRTHPGHAGSLLCPQAGRWRRRRAFQADRHRGRPGERVRALPCGA